MQTRTLGRNGLTVSVLGFGSTPTTVLEITRTQMVKALHEQHALSDRFIAHVLSRNVRIEQDLIDQLFNSSEKRLARTLLLLARYGKQEKPRQVVAKISQETLSEMVGRRDRA